MKSFFDHGSSESPAIYGEVGGTNTITAEGEPNLWRENASLKTGVSHRFLLASNSERRQALLKQIHAEFEILLLPDALDPETRIQRYPEESPKAYVMRLAVEKNKAARQFSAVNLPILTADTIVTLDNEILGKPKSCEMARNMLAKLSRKTHEVITAVIISLPDGTIQNCIATTKVTFARLSKTDIDWYLSVDNVMDKAGSYAIQESAALFVEAIEGSYSNVVGLPLFETGQLLIRSGLLKKTK